MFFFDSIISILISVKNLIADAPNCVKTKHKRQRSRKIVERVDVRVQIDYHACPKSNTSFREKYVWKVNEWFPFLLISLLLSCPFYLSQCDYIYLDKYLYVCHCTKMRISLDHLMYKASYLRVCLLKTLKIIYISLKHKFNIRIL